MASTSSSHRPSSSSNSKWRYDVFLSFRGEDTRNSFTAHLYDALDRGNIETFIDDEELPRGEEIAPELLKAIEGSRIAIIVFSKTYAHSKWCLEELVKIMECQEEKGQKVFPIFYHVEPPEVRNQTGTYGEAFKKHERNADEEKKKKIEKWRTALRKAGNLGGFPLQDRSEPKFIKEIIGEIRRLIPKLVHVGENIVGLDEKLEEVKLLIDTQSKKVSMVGIYGIGGIGKTTIAKAVYNDMLHQFKRHSFLENVREKSKGDRGVLQLQEKLLCDILMEKNLNLNNVDEGINMIIKSKHDLEKVLIVLDDVDCPEQLKFFAPDSKWFHPGSIIIVTTRNKRCLDVHKSYSSYEAKGLAHKQAKELFCWNAFQQRHPKDNYVDLSNRILDYAKDLPLALVVLGSFLFQRDVDEWESTLHKLKTNPLKDIQKVLQISYDGLDHSCKEWFLDITCFFKDHNEKFVTRILEGCGLHPKSGLKVLDERCLISILGGTIRMHDLLQEMGWAIVRQNDPKHPGKWSRLWGYEDIKSVFTKNMGTENIEGIFLFSALEEPIQFTAEAFRKLNRLRLLKVEFNIMQVSPDFELPCHDLKYLHWDYYPFESMPSNFHADNLVVLNLRRSSIKHLWKGNMCAKKLKVIDLPFSEHLVDISKISSVPNLEILNLQGCINLESLPRNLHELKCLQTLSCAGCSKIKSFPEIKQGNMGRLRELNLSETGIIELPSSIGHLHGLQDLDLSYCKNLESLPHSICSLSSLETLQVKNCPKLKPILEVNLGVDLTSLNLTCQILQSGVIWNNGCFSSLKTLSPQCDGREEEILNYISPLSSLVELSVGNSYLMERDILSGSFHLSSLQILSLRNFHLMKEGILSDIFHLSSLVELSLSKCNLREVGIPHDISNLSSLQSLSLSNCNLIEGQILNHICHLSSLKELSLDGNHFSSLPAGISQLSNLRALNLSHCKNLLQVPELPSSLRFLDVHHSDGISSSPSFLPIHSLINFSNSELISELHDAFVPRRQISIGRCFFRGNGISIAIPRSSGILEWIRCKSMGSVIPSIVTSSSMYQIELPSNWYEDNDFLGFALCCVYVASAYKSQNESTHTSENEPDHGCHLVYFCDLFIKVNKQLARGENLSYGSYCVSAIEWVICYPKVAIKEFYRSNQRTCLIAQFRGSLRVEECEFRGSLRVGECGIRLIYAEDYEQRHPTMAQGSTSHGNFGEHGSATEDTNRKAHNKRTPTKQSPVEESHHKRFRGTQD